SGRGNGHPGTGALRLDRAHRPDSVDMALHVVTAERLAGQKSGLEVDARPGGEPPERAASERLGHRVEPHAVAVDRLDGETDPVDRDGAADLDPRGSGRPLDVEGEAVVA